MADGSQGVDVKEGGESGVRARMVEVGPLCRSMPAAESSARYTSSGSRAAGSTCISMRARFLSVGGVEMYCAAEGFSEEGGPLVEEDGAVGPAWGGGIGRAARVDGTAPPTGCGGGADMRDMNAGGFES